MHFPFLIVLTSNCIFTYQLFDALVYYIYRYMFDINQESHLLLVSILTTHCTTYMQSIKKHVSLTPITLVFVRDKHWRLDMGKKTLCCLSEHTYTSFFVSVLGRPCPPLEGVKSCSHNSNL